MSESSLVKRKLRVSGASGRSSRSAIRIWLTKKELDELDRALAESGAWTRSHDLCSAFLRINKLGLFCDKS
jgi:hypothetical protein